MSIAPSSSSPLAQRVQSLLAGLAGVASVHVVARDGRIEEIHVLAHGSVAPKQMVRNVESALSAGLGIEIDRRVVSVARMRPGVTHPAETEDGADGEAGPTDEGGRPEYVGYESRSVSAQETTCRVLLRKGEREVAGVGQGPNTPQGRAEAGARAAFGALERVRGRSDLALEGVRVLEAHGRKYVLVAARALDGRHAQPLTGLAALERSPEEAAILAVLQATNRWAAFTP